MSDIRLQCMHASYDYLTVTRDDSTVKFRTPGDSVYTSDAGARKFANQILDFVGRGAADDVDIQRGDYVEVTKYRTNDRTYVGKQGRVTEIDTDHIPYYVAFDDGNAAWAVEVRKVPASASPFTTHIDEAKRLLADTAHTGADVVALARELADRA